MAATVPYIYDIKYLHLFSKRYCVIQQCPIFKALGYDKYILYTMLTAVCRKEIVKGNLSNIYFFLL